MFPVVIDGVGGFDPTQSAFWILASVEVPIEAREVAAGNLQAQAMSGKKDIAGGPHVDSELIDISRLHEFGFLLGVAVARPQDSIG